MTATGPVMAALERNWGMADRALDGMDEATMGVLTSTATQCLDPVAHDRVMDIFVHTRPHGRPRRFQ